MSDRRTFLTSVAAALLSAVTIRAKPSDSARDKHIRKAVLISLLPADLPFAKRFAMAREAGFDGI